MYRRLFCYGIKKNEGAKFCSHNSDFFYSQFGEDRSFYLSSERKLIFTEREQHKDSYLKKVRTARYKHRIARFKHKIARYHNCEETKSEL